MGPWDDHLFTNARVLQSICSDLCVGITSLSVPRREETRSRTHGSPSRLRAHPEILADLAGPRHQRGLKHVKEGTPKYKVP